MVIVVTASISPTFTQIGPLCQNSTAPALPTSSNNGTIGIWNPAAINTTSTGTSTYTFTPDASQCASIMTMDITITTSIMPTFIQIGPLCQNSAAPVLPTNSNNGISGTWNPETINTSSVGTSTYTFTPDAGQCAATATMDIVVTTSITPTFTQIGPLCQNSIAPAIPTNSNNGITGTWNPEIINTSAVGTTTYSFTPNVGQCAATATMDVVVTTSITPTFTQIGPLCQNSIAPVLPSTSTNGITGTWNPETLNTATFGTSTYTFTPDPGQCAGTTTMDIVVTTSITPTFTQIGPLFQNSVAPTLPGISNEGVRGEWDPAIINTGTVGTTTYTFNPDAGQCAVLTTINIEVTNLIIPSFMQLGPFCQNSTPSVLPSVSMNGISGTWNPAVINTAAAGSTAYTFAPDAGQGAAPATMIIEVTNPVTPTFTSIGPLCQNSTAPVLPAISNNGISGTWNPETINTSVAGTSTYFFTPDSGNCVLQPIMAEVSIYPWVQYHSETSDYNGFNIRCYGKSDGYIRIDPSTELAPFTFRWSGPDGYTATTEDIAEIKAGQHTLIITDRNMCTERDTFNLTEPDSLQISFDITEPYCPGSHDGEIKLNVTGGVPIPDYNYYWSDNSTGRNISDISQGFYKVTVSDINGCSVQNSVILNNMNIVCLEIPDAFSPNGDEINDFWNIGGIHLYPDAMIIIYNRWGQMLWKSERGYPVPWDGRSREKELPIDSYHYVIDLHNGSKPIVGPITIIR
jgi:gliding motility-associated-like protein